MPSKTVTYTADNLVMEGQIFLPNDITGPRPGILVFPDAFGLGEQARATAERLSEMGFVALAADLHGGGALLGSMDELHKAVGQLSADPARTRARAQGALDVLTALDQIDNSRIAAIGYCFGGTMALELARSGADIRGAFGFHSGLGTTRPQDAVNIKAKIVVCVGSDDPVVPLAQRTAFEEEMRAGKVDWQLHLYGGVRHAFTNPSLDALGNPALKYDAAADARSWRTMTALFEEIF